LIISLHDDAERGEVTSPLTGNGMSRSLVSVGYEIVRDVVCRASRQSVPQISTMEKRL